MILLKNNDPYKKLVFVAILLLVIVASANFVTQLLVDLNIKAIRSGVDIDLEILQLWSELNAFTILMWFFAQLFLIITLILWTKRIYSNYKKFHIITAYSENIAALSWIIPILCLYAPLQVMIELFKGTKKTIAQRNKHLEADLNTHLLTYWWISFVVFLIIKQATSYLTIYGSNQLMTFSFLQLLTCIAFAILTVKVIQEYAAAEETLHYAIKKENEKEWELKRQERERQHPKTSPQLENVEM